MRPFSHDGPGTSARAWAERREWDQVAQVDLAAFDRVVVVAAHPDDETLGAGGLMACAATAGVEVDLLVCTSGEHSHPRSTTHPPDLLALRRKQEVRSALRELAPAGRLTLVGLEDGRVSEHEAELAAVLVAMLGDARGTLVVAPWRRDGHPDHEAAGRAAATAVRRSGAALWEYPIWWWHWARPDEAPWDDLRCLALTDEAVARRTRALAHHRTQIEPLSAAPGDEALLPARLLEHFAGRSDRFLVQPVVDDAIDRLHRTVADPWGVDHRHYERRKRDLTLAMLPRERFGRALEVGCSVGALTAELAARCDTVVAVDSSPAAVDGARRRLDADRHVEVRCADVPAEWPEGSFDLVVLSEVGYFLSPAELDTVVRRLQDCLSPDGVLLLCHWRHPIEGWVLDGARVHAAVESSGLRPVQARYTEPDFVALVLAAETAWPELDG